MKKYIFILVFAVVAMAANAQSGHVYTVPTDTLKGIETINFAIATLRVPSYKSLNITALCTQIGGTSDGTIAIYGSLDNTNWTFINGVGGDVITASPQASITGADLNQVTITNGLVANWVIKDVPYIYFRGAAVGTALDTTQVDFKYMYK